MQGVSVAGGAGYESKGGSKVGKRILPSAATAQESWAEVERVYQELKGQKPTATLTGEGLSGAQLLPGVYRVKGNAHLKKTMELMGSKFPGGVFIFQVEGDLTLDPSVAVALRQGIRARNVFWQVAGNVQVGAKSSLAGTVVAAGNISAGKEAQVEGKLLTKAGKVALSNTQVGELRTGTNTSDLEVKYEASSGPYRVGLVVTYTVTLKNLGPHDETNVVLNFETTSGIQLLSAVTSTGSLFDLLRREWVIDEFASGSTATMVVKGSILKPEFSSSIVTVTGNGRDPNILNNTAEGSICATPSQPGPITGLTSLCVNTTGNVYRIAPLLGTRKYTWTLPPGWTITSGEDTNVITVSTGAAEANGTISVRAVNACGEGPESVLDVSTVSFPPPMPSAITGPSDVCVGQRDIIFSIPAIASAVSYTWDLPLGWTIVKGHNSPTVTVNAGLWGGDVKVTAENGCGKSASAKIKVDLSPAAPQRPESISGPEQVCANSTGNTYQIAAVPFATSYTWVVPTGWAIERGQGSATVVVRSGTTPGQITVKAQNSCGISMATTLPVGISAAAPTVGTILGETALCSSTASHTYSLRGMEEATTFVWTVPADWQILSGHGSRTIEVRAGSGGEVKVVASNACGQAAPLVLNVSVNSGPPVMPGIVSGLSAPCSGQEGLVYSVVPVANTTGYTWTVPAGWTIVSGQGEPSIRVKAGAAAGEISVTASNGCGSTTARVLPVTPAQAAPVAPAAIAGETVPCIGARQTYSVPNPVAGVTYTWSLPTGWTMISEQGSSTMVVTASTASGQVTVTASNQCGMSAPTSLAVWPTGSVPALAGTIQGEGAVCASTQDLTYSIISSNAASTFNWQVPAGWNIVKGQGTPEIKVTAGSTGGNITVSAVNGCGQSDIRTLAVAVSASIPTTAGQIAGPATLCASAGEVTYRVPEAGGNSFTWSVPEGWAIVRGQGSNAVVVLVGATAGEIKVQARNACGTSAASVLAVRISTSAPAAVGPVSGEQAFCASPTSRTYSVAEVTGATAYTWHLPAGWEILTGHGTKAINVRPGATGGYVKVVASNDCGARADSTLVTVSQPLSTAPFSISGAKAACSSGEPITYTVPNVPGATHYTWSVPAGWQILEGQNGTTLRVKPGTGAGTVSLVATNACGTSASASLPVTISDNSPLVLGAITGQSVTCTTSRVTYQVPADASVNTYTWSVPAGWRIESGHGTHSITVLPGATAGLVSVIGVNGCGVTSSPSTLHVQVQAELPLRPNPIHVNAAALTPCTGQKGLVFKIDGVNGATSYEWSVPAGWKIESGQGGTTLTVTAGNQPGQISVVAKNGCGQSESRAVAVVPSVGAPVINGNIIGSAMVCANAGSVTFSINSTGATQFLWSVPAGWNLVSGQNSPTITVLPTTSGGTVTVVAQNSCGVSVVKSLTVASSEAGTLNPGVITGPTAYCASAEERTYTVSQVAGAVTYEWTVPAGWKIIRGQGTTRIVVSTQAGTGVVSVKGVNGCGSSANATLPVTVAPALGVPPVILDESSACVGNQFSVPTVAGVSYKWSLVSDTPGWTITAGQGSHRVMVQGPANAPNSSARIVVEANNGTCSTTSASVDITPKYLASELHLPNVFSPNNDRQNDTWTVRNLLEYPENDLVILNRWGSEVYRMKGYRNTWDGGGLADGTYYYVLKVRLCEGQEVTHKGYITIMR
ncbi:hypothetical protein GCM10011405_34140 [Rufibacter glacialis]|nr:hypothetical protein GCM10011405_34140 [Rufibacter glacialis]